MLIARVLKVIYLIRVRVLELVHLADPSAFVEVPGLFPSAPSLRPADIFTSAASPGRSTALDVGVCCPDACHAGIDCCDSMHQHKVDKYRKFLTEAEIDFEYRPLVFSCYGRVHPESEAILKTLAQGAARRRGMFNYQLLLARLHRNIGVEIWRRVASMVHACMPKLTSSECCLLNGTDESGDPYPGSGRLNTLTSS